MYHDETKQSEKKIGKVSFVRQVALKANKKRGQAVLLVFTISIQSDSLPMTQKI